MCQFICGGESDENRFLKKYYILLLLTEQSFDQNIFFNKNLKLRHQMLDSQVRPAFK